MGSSVDAAPRVVRGFEAQDPFLMIGFHDDVLPPSSALSEAPGFPNHPHAGFETVTITVDALVDHADSLGGSGRYGDGDVQWMCAGKGVSHSEMAGLRSDTEANGGALFQLWLNLPAATKRCDPATVMFWKEDLDACSIAPRASPKSQSSASPPASARVIAGPGAPRQPPPGSWAADPRHHVQIVVVELPPGSSYVVDRLGAGSSTLAAYAFRGDDVRCGDARVPLRHTAIFGPRGASTISLRNPADAAAPANVLVLEADPIGEPVHARGPFVAASERELAQCFADYRRGALVAPWPWHSDGPAHGVRPRFYDDPASGAHEERGPPITLHAPGPPSYLPDLLQRLARFGRP